MYCCKPLRSVSVDPGGRGPGPERADGASPREVLFLALVRCYIDGAARCLEKKRSHDDGREGSGYEPSCVSASVVRWSSAFRVRRSRRAWFEQFTPRRDSSGLECHHLLPYLSLRSGPLTRQCRGHTTMS